jgi:hypothetical protein
MLIVLHGVQPLLPPTAWRWVRPRTVRFQNAIEANHPWRELDVDVGHFRPEEEGPVRRESSGGVDEFFYFGLELLRVFGLFGDVLGLEELVEGGDDLTIDLSWFSKSCILQQTRDTHVIRPEAACRSELRVVGWKERDFVIQVLQLPRY